MPDIGLRLGIEGEKAFKQALADINQSFKILGSEMRLVESEFDKQDSSVAALTAKNEVLNKQIDEQKNKIATLQKALANAAESFGENDRRTQSWAIQLNNATADLNKMERELSNNEKTLSDVSGGMDDAAKETRDFNEAIDDAGKSADEAGGRFDKLGSVVKGIGAVMATAFAAVGAAAVSAGKALVDMSVNGAAYADEVLTTSTQTGIATDKLQEYMYAAELVDVSVDTLTKSMAKQIKSMKSAQDGSASFADAYKKLGITVTNADGTLRDSDTVYWETIEALGNMKNETERDAIAMTLLGKSAQELNPLIEAGAGKMAELGKQAQAAGYVINDKMLDAYGALDDQLQYLSVGATAAKNALGTVLLPILTDLAGDGVDLLGEFTNGVLAANGDIGKIADVVGEVLPKVLDMIMEYVPVIMNIIMEVVSSLGKTLIDNLPMLVETAGQIIFSILEGMISALPQITEGALQLILTLTQGLIENLPLIVEAALQMIVTLAKGIAEALPELVPSLVEAVVYICKTLVDNIDLIIQAAISLITGLAEGIIKALPIIIEALPKIIDGIITALTGNIPLLIEAGFTLFTSLIKNLPAIIVAIIKAIPQIITSLVNGFGDYMGDIIGVGTQLIKGIWQGIKDAGAWLSDKISGFFDGIVGSIKSFFGIHSPSTLFAGLGENMALGIGVGFGDMMSKVSKDMRSAIPTSFDADVSYTGGGGGYGDIIVPVNLDGNVITKSTGRIQYKRNQAFSRALGVSV